MALSIMTFNIMTVSIRILSIMALSITKHISLINHPLSTLSMRAISISILSITIQMVAPKYYSDCRNFDIMLSVIVHNVVLAIVVAPFFLH